MLRQTSSLNLLQLIHQETRLQDFTPSPGLSTTLIKRNPATRRIQRRERALTATGDIASEEFASPEQVGTSKRPKLRLQLNVQMFRKHPVFKFFVTAPVDSVDSDSNNHK